MQLPSDPPPNTLSNPSAPSSLPRALAIPLSIISTISYILLLPSYLLFQTTIYYTLGPPYPGWTLGTLLFTRGLGLLLSFQYRFGLPQPDRASAFKVPIGARRKGCAVECRRVAGIPKAEEDELRVGWMRQTSVKVVDVPGFMVWPEVAPLSKTTVNGNGNGNANANANANGKGYAKAQEGEKIIYYLVGGGFISGHPLRTHLAWWSSKLVGVRLFAVNYRKSLSVDTAFPACLVDALAGYLFLIRDLGFKPSNIILMGDSAGGNLALALARYLGELAERGVSERTKNIGQVGGMILYSPWCDMTFAGESCIKNKNTDYVGGFGNAGVASHTRHFPSFLSSPYFSPALPLPNNAPRFEHLVEAGVKVYIHTGTAELLYSEDLDLARDMKKEGVDVRLREVEGEIHAAILFRREKAMRASEKDIPEFWNSLGQ